MKKSIFILGIIAATSLIGSGSLNAQNSNANAPAFQPGKFVDENKNGICDNYENRPAYGRGWGRRNAHGGRFVDANNNGICDYRENSSANGKGLGFVDKNNDGICDNYPVGRRNGWRHGWNKNEGRSWQNQTSTQPGESEKK
ncbi:MAG: hypothetical protein HPY80_03825 [Bacteroidales bacterium]|jgi:hypothetical protein|nr:hypothetical protein [Bacteroidales bacterium]NPV35784.1 hypothetical protein [Bacteroidales bacterium]